MRKLLFATSLAILMVGVGPAARAAPRAYPRGAWWEAARPYPYPQRYALVPNCYASFGPGLLGCRPQVVAPDTFDVTVALRSISRRSRRPYPALFAWPYGPDAR